MCLWMPGLFGKKCIHSNATFVLHSHCAESQSLFILKLVLYSHDCPQYFQQLLFCSAFASCNPTFMSDLYVRVSAASSVHSSDSTSHLISYNHCLGICAHVLFLIPTFLPSYMSSFVRFFADVYFLYFQYIKTLTYLSVKCARRFSSQQLAHRAILRHSG